MTNSSKDMTKGSPFKLISAFAIPVFLSQLFQQLYNTVDTLIVGRFLGTEALAAVSSSGTLIALLVSFFTGTSMGAGVVISKYFGAKEKENVNDAVHTNIALSLLSGIFLTFVGVIFTPLFLKWMGTDPDVMPDAIAYFRFYFLGALAIVLYNDSKGIMNALGDSIHPLYYLIFSSVVNIVLDVVFIGVFNWGVWSAAFATTVSQGLSALLCISHLCGERSPVKLVFKNVKIKKEILAEIIRYGLPSGIQNSVIGFANVIVQSKINVFGKVATAAYGSFAKIEGFAFLPITSFTMAVTTFTSQNLGDKQYERTKQGSVFGILASVILAEFIGALIWQFAPFLMKMFTNDGNVIATGVMQARVESLFFCLLAFSHSIAAVCRGSGKAFVPMFIMMSVWCVIRIIYITIITSIFHELKYIYWAYPLTWTISSVIYLIYYLRSDWLHGFETEKHVHHLFIKAH